MTHERALLVYALIKGISINVGLEIQLESIYNVNKEHIGLIYPNLITYLCSNAGVSLRNSNKIFPDKPITGNWLQITIKKHNKAILDWIANQQRQLQEELGDGQGL
ncbi:hypothetical protein ACH5RR_023034 [Cinchona calisaya]|uniref:Uncharacterized protein n=1 Tax=Cinchona calisaya TaxID=153742 RepID=A0ABD2Z9H7_9GENT